VCLLTAIDKADPHAELLVMGDPANNALVSSNGFSGRLWFGLTDVGRDRPAITEPHRWLQPEQINIPIRGSHRQPRADSTPLQIPPVRPVPPETGRLQTRPLLTNSTIRLEGNLQRRQLLNPPALPTWEFTDVLLPTSVQVMLDEHGHVINATLLSRSGLAAADERALEFARGLTFAQANDASSAGLEWGIITFVWVTREPAPVSAPAPSSTNAPAPVS
ncbi:MAG: energy transducer TonB, partial [Verrucomicrobiia bacterium]